MKQVQSGPFRVLPALGRSPLIQRSELTKNRPTLRFLRSLLVAPAMGRSLPSTGKQRTMKNEPLEGNLHDGTEDRECLDRDPIQPDLLPTQLNLLRWKLSQKAKSTVALWLCTPEIHAQTDGSTLALRGKFGSDSCKRQRSAAKSTPGHWIRKPPSQTERATSPDTSDSASIGKCPTRPGRRPNQAVLD